MTKKNVKEKKKPVCEIIDIGDIDMSMSDEELIASLIESGMPKDVSEIVVKKIRSTIKENKSDDKPMDKTTFSKFVKDGVKQQDVISKTNVLKNIRGVSKPDKFDLLGGIITPITGWVISADSPIELTVNVAKAFDKPDLGESNTIGYMAAVKGPRGRIHIGISFCVPGDHSKFSPEYGRRTAKARAVRMMQTELTLDNAAPMTRFKRFVLDGERGMPTNHETCYLFNMFARNHSHLFLKSTETCDACHESRKLKAYVMHYTLHDQLNRFIHRCEKYFKTDNFCNEVSIMRERYAKELLDKNSKK